MNNKQLQITLIVLFLIATAVAIGFIYFKPNVANAHPSEESEHAQEDFKRGPHNGRLLQEDDFQIEVTIFEPEGTPPKFRIYFYDKGAPIQPSDVTIKMQLERINRKENIPFKQESTYLESTVEASEPHSFKVKIAAQYKGKSYSWEYATYEGRVELTQEAISANGIAVAKASSKNLAITLNAMGKIVPDAESTVSIAPRFAGVVKAVHKKLGDKVEKGETIAIIESNDSLQNYEIKAEMSGTIIKKEINKGMYVSGQENVFAISDLSSVWVELHIYTSYVSQIKVGNQVEVKSLDGKLKQIGAISYLSPIGNEVTQSVVARVTLSNLDGLWKPGLFVSGEIAVDEGFARVAVKESALQTFRDWDVVFIAVGHIFEVAPVKVGRKSQGFVEIITGLNDGDHYVAENSYILKADLEKSGAKHEH